MGRALLLIPTHTVPQQQHSTSGGGGGGATSEALLRLTPWEANGQPAFDTPVAALLTGSPLPSVCTPSACWSANLHSRSLFQCARELSLC